MPGPGFQRVSIEQPKLDCSDVGLGDDQELWLLQLPHDVSGARCGPVGQAGACAAPRRASLSVPLVLPPLLAAPHSASAILRALCQHVCCELCVCAQFPVGEPVSWELSQHAQDGYRGRCTVQGEASCMGSAVLCSCGARSMLAGDCVSAAGVLLLQALRLRWWNDPLAWHQLCRLVMTLALPFHHPASCCRCGVRAGA